MSNYSIYDVIIVVNSNLKLAYLVFKYSKDNLLIELCNIVDSNGINQANNIKYINSILLLLLVILKAFLSSSIPKISAVILHSELSIGRFSYKSKKESAYY